jgi:hypothetical protein
MKTHYAVALAIVSAMAGAGLVQTLAREAGSNFRAFVVEGRISVGGV